MKDIFKQEPEFVNEVGVKWWRDHSTTHYAQKPDINGITLNAVCFYPKDFALTMFAH